MEDQSVIKGKIYYKKGMRPKISHFWSKKGEQKRDEERRREEEEKKKRKNRRKVWKVWFSME